MSTILIVDDDDDVTALLDSVLTISGYRVEIAVNGIEAVERVKEVRPDLLILDLNIPFLNGYEVLNIIKANPKTKSLPVLIMSHHTNAIDREEAYLDGCEAFIAKPIDLGNLLKLASDLLSPLSKTA